MADRDKLFSPSRADAGITTAPLLNAADEIAELRAEINRLKARLGEREAASAAAEWPQTITYAEQVYSGARLGGITKNRDRIRNTSEVAEFPKPTRDPAQLEADFVRWGYCLLADAMTPQQVQAQVDRLVDQAAAERTAGVAMMSHFDAEGTGRAQFVPNLVPKGQVFRDLIALEPTAVEQGPLVEELLRKILGKGWYLCTAHGSIVHTGGGLQELHQDQGFIPLPHPPFPLYCLLIWCYSDFNLENGGTYIIPGSHRFPDGNSRVHPESAFEQLAAEGLYAIDAPAGTCILTDSRVLHSGGTRTAPGTRYASRILYGRAFVRQQENQMACIPDDVLQGLTPKLKALIGFKPHLGLGMVEGNALDPFKPKVVVGELSLSQPESLKQDFDWRYSEQAKVLSAKAGAFVDYRTRKPD